MDFNNGAPTGKQFGPQGGSDTKELFGLIGLGCSCLGCLLTVIFSIVTCSRGYKCMKFSLSSVFELKMSKWIIGVIIAVIIAMAGVVLAILSIEKGSQISKVAMIAVIVGSVAILYGVFTNATICGYNCSINNALEDEVKKAASSYDFDW